MLRLLFITLLLTLPCPAHLPSSSVLDLSAGTWTVALAVLDDAWLIDGNSDGKLSAAEWQVLEECVRRELKRGLISESSAELEVTEVTADITGAAPRVVAKFSLPPAGGQPSPVTCRLLAKDDPLHRVVHQK